MLFSGNWTRLETFHLPPTRLPHMIWTTENLHRHDVTCLLMLVVLVDLLHHNFFKMTPTEAGRFFQIRKA